MQDRLAVLIVVINKCERLKQLKYSKCTMHFVEQDECSNGLSMDANRSPRM